MSEDLQNVVKGIVGMLVRNDYERLASHTNGIRLNAAEIARAVADYGRTLVEPPADGYRLARVVAIKPAKFPAWSVTMPLWTKEEGRSDLSIQLTLIRTENDFLAELDDIHVL